jgi:serine/threonine-protein kinase
MDAIALFRELADLSPSEREGYFASHHVPRALRAEVESLLRFDGGTSGSMRGSIAEAARDAAATGAIEDGPDAEIGPYRLVREIGRGGMGTVWLARRTDGSLKRSVALKLLRWDYLDRQLTERFSRERDILAALTHPNIARLYDAGVSHSGRPYLALEYVDGEPLTAYAEHQKLDVHARIVLFLQVVDAVQYAHRNLIIHRDLKPGNILVSADGVVHLLDFGIAKLLADAQSAAVATELTQEGGRPLTLEYASPEQIAGLALTTASDVYSLGVVLYELLCGTRPYRLGRGTKGELEAAILTAEPVPPSRATTDRKRTGSLRGDLDTIVLRSLKKDPAERYATSDAFARDLRNFLERRPVEARPDSRVYRLAKFWARHRAAVTAAAAVILVILTSLVFALVQMREARAQRDAALFEARRAAASLQLTSFLVGQARLSPGDPSVADRLKRSRDLVNRQFAGEPAIRAELLFDVAEKLAELRDLVTLGEVMDELAVVARETDLPWVQARYRCAAAELKMNEGETEAAAILLREAAIHLARERPPQFAASVACLVSESYLASLAGNIPLAVDRGQAATRLHEEQGQRDTTSYADAWAALITAYSFSGDTRSALDAVRRQRETYERLGQDDTFSYLTSLFLEATFLNRGGRRSEALARSTRLLEQAKARGVPDNQSELAYRAIILLGTGHAGEALALFDGAARWFEGQNMELDAIQMHIWAADTLLHLGSIRAARSRLDAHWPTIESHIAANNPSMTKGLRVLARLLAAEGRLAEARQTIQRATDLIEASKSPTYSGASSILQQAAVLALAGADSSLALRHINGALERSTRDAIDPLESADVGELLVTRARIHRTRGELSDADRDLAAARGHFKTTLPPEHPLVREAALAAVDLKAWSAMPPSPDGRDR